MVKNIQFKISFSNRALYTLIAAVLIIIAGMGVYAYNSAYNNPGVFGHSANEIEEADPTVPDSVKDGVDWSEITGIPAGFADGVDDVGGSGSVGSGSRALGGKILQVINTQTDQFKSIADSSPTHGRGYPPNDPYYVDYLTLPGGSRVEVGTEIFSEQITPINSGSRIKIDVKLSLIGYNNLKGPNLVGQCYNIITLFKNSEYFATAAAYGDTLSYVMNAGGTNPITFKVKAFPSGGCWYLYEAETGTYSPQSIYLNKEPGWAPNVQGGTSSMTITEISP